jgi:hypothetical protein
VHLIGLRSFLKITSSSIDHCNDLRMLNNPCPIVTSGLEIKRATLAQMLAFSLVEADH